MKDYNLKEINQFKLVVMEALLKLIEEQENRYRVNKQKFTIKSFKRHICEEIKSLGGKESGGGFIY